FGLRCSACATRNNLLLLCCFDMARKRLVQKQTRGDEPSERGANGHFHPFKRRNGLASGNPLADLADTVSEVSHDCDADPKHSARQDGIPVGQSRFYEPCRVAHGAFVLIFSVITLLIIELVAVLSLGGFSSWQARHPNMPDNTHTR